MTLVCGGGVVQTPEFSLAVKRGWVRLEAGRVVAYSADARFTLRRSRQSWAWAVAGGLATIGAAVFAALVVMTQ